MDSPPLQDRGRNRRKNLRRIFNFPGRMHFAAGAPAGTCIIIDMSETGAQLAVRAGTTVPDEFSLLIGGRSDVQRKCRVMWRSNNRLGVQFLGTPQNVKQ